MNNFISKGVVKDYNLRTRKVPGILVKGYNKKPFPSRARICRVETKPTLIVIKDYIESIMFSVLEKSTILVILGRSWLCKHKPKID